MLDRPRPAIASFAPSVVIFSIPPRTPVRTPIQWPRRIPGRPRWRVISRVITRWRLIPGRRITRRGGGAWMTRRPIIRLSRHPARRPITWLSRHPARRPITWLSCHRARHSAVGEFLGIELIGDVVRAVPRASAILAVYRLFRRPRGGLYGDWGLRGRHRHDVGCRRRR